MKPDSIIRIAIGGGGTGGHIFPAIAIANEVKRRLPNADILFVGAENRMEMERVPKAGYRIEGLRIRGLYRSLTLKNIGVVRDYLQSTAKAVKILRNFQPHIVVGVGGYASAPVVRAAAKLKIPVLLQEQNSYAGLTNKILAKKAAVICVAYEGMEKYFPAEKIINLGNPVRNLNIDPKLRAEALKAWKFDAANPVLLIVGGSLGARTLNQALQQGIKELTENGIQVIWQTGKYYYEKLVEEVNPQQYPNLRLMDFISNMEEAYNAADLIVSRAGALSISEICLTGKASILVPSPNVAEDHQTSNARALANNDAALMVSDAEAKDKLVEMALHLLGKADRRQGLGDNAKKMAKPEATGHIVDELLKLVPEV